MTTTDDHNSYINTIESPILAAEQDYDSYWIDNYPSIARALEHSQTPTSTALVPPRRNPRRTPRPGKLTPFPPVATFAIDSTSQSTASSVSPNTSTNGQKDRIISIYPSEILSPSSGQSERNSVELSPLKSVRFAPFHTRNNSESTNSSTTNNYAYIPSNTASHTHTRANSDPRTPQGKNSLKTKFGLRPISDPNPPHIDSVIEDLPLRGDIPKMSSRSANGKRVDRDPRVETLRSREYDRIGREYGPANLLRPIRTAPKDLETIARLESSLILESFTTHDAWALGTALRDRLVPHPTPTTIHISLSSGLVLFHCTTKSGTTLDSSLSISRKVNTVLRWGVSTWYLWCKYGGDEVGWRTRNFGGGGGFFKGGERGGGEGYEIGGGAVPLRVKGVEGVVAVVVVGGLKGEEGHEVIVETIQEHWY